MVWGIQIIGSVWVPGSCGTLGMWVRSCGPLPPCLYWEVGITEAPLACRILSFSWHREKNAPKEKFCENVEIDSGIFSICLILFFYLELFLWSRSWFHHCTSNTGMPSRTQTNGVSECPICCSSASLFSSLIYRVGVKEKESGAELWLNGTLYRMMDSSLPGKGFPWPWAIAACFLVTSVSAEIPVRVSCS